MGGQSLAGAALRGLAAVAGLGGVLLLFGCGGGGIATPGSPPTLAPSGLTSDAQASPTPDRMDGNPFSDNSALALAGREVIANPTVAEVMQPAGDLPEMALGRPDAPVTFIKYASMTCPFCRQFQIEAFPELKRHYIDTGKMRFIIREFPIGFQSGIATIALRCVAPDKYFQAYDRLMRQQSQWVSQEVRPEPVQKVMEGLGLKREQLDACRQDKALVGALDAIKQRGRMLGIVGTPNFFVNGRLVKSTLSLKDVKDIVDPLLSATPPRPQTAAQKS